MQLFSPLGFGRFQPPAYSSQDDPVRRFGEAVGLRVFYICEALFDADVPQVVLELLISELSPIVGYHQSRHSEPCQNVSLEEKEYVLCCDLC